MKPKVLEGKSDVWKVCTSVSNKHKMPFKLHVALPHDRFLDHYEAIYTILRQAVEYNIISEFKMLNIVDYPTLKDNPNVRIVNNPFTIYLEENFDNEEISELCLKIENKLKKTPKIDSKNLSIADLPISDHLTFRQENLNGEYLNIEQATFLQLKELKTLTEASKEYVGLKKAMDAKNNTYPTWLIILFCIPIAGQLGFILYKFLDACMPDEENVETNSSNIGPG